LRHPHLRTAGLGHPRAHRSPPRRRKENSRMMVKGWLAAGTLATVSLLMSAAAVASGATAIRHAPDAAPVYHGSHGSQAPPTVGGLRIGVASDPVTKWNKATGVKASLTAYYLSMAAPVSPHYVSW